MLTSKAKYRVSGLSRRAPGYSLAMLVLFGISVAGAQSLKHDPEILVEGPMRIEPVADGLYVIRGPFLPCAPNGCTPGGRDDGLIHESGDVAVRITPSGLIVVDNKFPNHVPQIMQQIRKVSALPVRYVLNSHHHADHVGGNAVLSQLGVEIIGHENVRANFLRLGQPGEPNVVYRDQTAVFLGGVEVRMLYLGRGHTNGDSIIYFPDLKVVHAGDLIVDGMPVMDYPAGGSAVEYVRTIEKLLELDFEILIPGHGRLMTRDEVVAYRARFAEMNRRMRDIARRGVPKSEAQAALFLEDLGWANTVSTTTWATSIDQYYDEMAAQ